MIQKLFVYGTLRQGQENAYHLEKIKGQWSTAKVKGRLLYSGTKRTEGYPALFLDSEADWVEGMVFSSFHLHKFWKALDKFEGSGYQRKKISVVLDNGTTTLAYIYEAKG